MVGGPVQYCGACCTLTAYSRETVVWSGVVRCGVTLQGSMFSVCRRMRVQSTWQMVTQRLTGKVMGTRASTGYDYTWKRVLLYSEYNALDCKQAATCICIFVVQIDWHDVCDCVLYSASLCWPWRAVMTTTCHTEYRWWEDTSTTSGDWMMSPLNSEDKILQHA